MAALAPYRKNPYLYKTIDTVIGQDRGLDITLLPGEFKILKVEILRSNDVAGELAHSNQTKLTAHALMRRENGTGPWIESDTIVQYMTYHKQIPGNDTGWTGVYFRKSKPASKKMNTAAPQWEEEYLLSDSLFHTARWNTHDTCAYPSIVTRFDSVSLEYRSHVVFACNVDTLFGKSYDQQYIFESVVRVSEDTAMVRAKTGCKEFGRVMDSVSNRNMRDWGTPMVNASDTANFYCWADPDIGIIAGWKKPDSIPVPLVTQIGIHWTDLTNVDCHIINAQHPSMNAYSRYIEGEGESDCALVWQEKNDCTVAIEHIFYTRLRIENGQIVHGLSPHYGADPMVGGVFNTDSSIVCMSTTNVDILDSVSASHKYPVVYRELFNADSDTLVCNFNTWYPGHFPTDVRFDGVFWQYEKLVTPDTNPIPIPLTNISVRWIWQRDTVISGGFVPDTIRLGWIGILWSHQESSVLDQPVVSAGEAYYYPTTENWSGCVNYSDRVMNLNFRWRPMYIEKTPLTWNHWIYDSLAEILHLPQTHQYPHAPYIPISIVDKGYLSNAHLAERGTLQINDWQRNHRIYNKRSGPETTPEPPPPIRTSGQYFFKTAGEETIARQIHSFGDDLSSFGIAMVEVRDKEYPIVHKPSTIPYPILIAPDTLSTNWFTVDYFEELRLITAGNAPEKLNAFLERRSDGAVWEVTCNSGEQMKLSDEQIDLYDGNNDEYRFRVYSHEGASYRPETAITSENEVSSFKSSQLTNKSINLGGVFKR
ncbi:MAG: hypothetical protein IPM69_15445 [Ignavibacteria bacterium]|nr:hypothetical protein [Ignavibacteria bacterium]